LCPHGDHLFASLEWSTKRVYSLEAIVLTTGYVMQ
jgi:hypothetical protein